MKTRMDRSVAEMLADDLYADLMALYSASDVRVEIHPKDSKKLLADFIEGLADAVEYDMLDDWMHRRSQEPIGQ